MSHESMYLSTIDGALQNRVVAAAQKEAREHEDLSKTEIAAQLRQSPAMAIQWYPGHMTKARRLIAESMPLQDVIVEVLDARMPRSSENPLVTELRRQLRSAKAGYAVWWLPWDGQPAGDAEPFATGFLPDGAQDALGRPAGLAVGADGALYVSDDKAGYIYRIARR